MQSPGLIGTVLRGRYQVVSALARGGFGETYVVEDIDLPGHPRCVLKHLAPASRDTFFLDHARRLFQAEAETLMRLGKHNQIPQLMAYFEENKEFYLVQELVEGHPLSDEMKPGDRWAELDVQNLLADVLNVLQFIHSEGVIHRDIKPDNLIRRHQDNKLVLVDFGTVKEIRQPGFTRRTSSGGSALTVGVGTPGYMPNEQSNGRPRPNSDIYALGIIGIQAVTGLYPDQFQEDSATGEIIWKPWANISDKFAEILTQMVRYYFRDRYQSVEEVLQDLENLPGAILRDSSPSPESLPPQPTVISAQDSNSGSLVNPPHETLVSLPPNDDHAHRPAAIEPIEQADSTSNAAANASASQVDRPPMPTWVDPQPTPQAASSQSSQSTSANSHLNSPQSIPPIPTWVDTSSSPTPSHPSSSARPQETPSRVRSNWPPQVLWLGLGGAAVGLLVVSAIGLNQLLQSSSTTPAQSSQSPQPIQSLPTSSSIPINTAAQDQSTFDQALSTSKDGKSDSLEQAMKIIQAIPASSDLYAKAQEQKLKWQTQVLDDYINKVIPEKHPKKSKLINTAKPVVTQVSDQKVIITCEVNTDDPVQRETLLRVYTLGFMEMLRGNPVESFPPKYAEFQELVIRMKAGEMRALLDAKSWDQSVRDPTYEPNAVLAKVKIEGQ
ncbi:protein kinase domain-containing protein [Alkalinema pantanalense CENA528]|uniref:protein kinase domain-containing protein n=1 Tax=Alkalinema pantanalense TaxID=1620705 RepID=UPI003D6E47D6